VQLDDSLFAEFVAAMRLLVRFSTKEVAAVLLVLDFAGVADSVKDIVKPSISKKGFLRRGFLNLSLAMKVSTPHSLLLESILSSLTLDVKEDGVIGFPSPLSGCVTPIIEKGNGLRVYGLSQSQKWPVGFDPSGEVVVWEQGDENWDGEVGDSPYHLGFLPPNMALDWEVDSVEDEDLSSAILDAFEEDFLREVKAMRPKSKGRREILNLVSSINYGDASTQHRKCKAHVR